LSTLAIKLYPEALRSIAFGSVSGTYAKLGTALSNPSRQYYLVNGLNVMITLSWDGSTDHFVVPAGSYILLDVTSNASLPGGVLSIAQGTQTWVKQTSGAAGSGSVYLSSFYGAGAPSTL